MRNFRRDRSQNVPRRPRSGCPRLVAGAAQAQPAGKVPVVGVMNSGAGPRSVTVDTTRQGLRDLGYVDGQTIAFDVRFAGLKPDAFPGLAADLVRRKVDVLLVERPGRHPGRERCNQRDPDRGARPGERPRAGWVCPQPRAAGREHHGLLSRSTRADRQMAGADRRGSAGSSPHRGAGGYDDRAVAAGSDQGGG